jgi:hypothetical protein
MKFISLILILLAFPIISQAQDLLKVEKKVLSKRNPKIMEYFQVKTSDESIRNGFYVKLYNKDTVETGFYKDNLKDGIWVAKMKGQKVAEGHYLEGERMGIWSFFLDNTQIIHVFDYDKDSLVYYNP